MSRFLLIITALLLVSPLSAAPEQQATTIQDKKATASPKQQNTPPIATYKAHFKVYVSGIKMGEIERSLKKHKNGLYEQSSLIYTTGLLSVFRGDRFEEHSYWRWQNNTLVPQRYTYSYTGTSRGDVYEQLDFDWKKMTVASLRDGKTTVLDIKPGVVDKLSYQVALVQDLRAGKKEFSYQVADRGDIRNIRYEVIGKDMVETPWGKRKTIKVRRKTLTKERVTTLWFAPDLDYMVVKLIQNDGGTEMSGTINDLHIDGMKIVKSKETQNEDKGFSIWPSD